jgi:Holliday junction resolvasome RuvABC endonuclease subunit
MNLKIKKLEKDLSIKLKRNMISLGLDCATRTGWCIATTSKVGIDLTTGFMKFNTKDRFSLYNMFIQEFTGLIQPNHRVVIEESYFGTNPKTFQLLSRIGMIAYMIAQQKGITNDNITMITPSGARASLGFKGNARKEQIHEEFLKKTGLQLHDPDVIDAVILSLVGLVK